MTSFDAKGAATPRALVLDIDGVLTDGTEGVDSGGKSLFLRDLDALTRVRNTGVIVAFLTGEDEDVARGVVDRCGGGPAIYGSKDKGEGIKRIAHKLGVSMSKLCYVGDADRDAAAMRAVGLAFAPSDASSKARSAADKVVRSRGGRGAVEEVVALVFDEARIDTAAMKDAVHEELHAIARIVSDFAVQGVDNLVCVISVLERCLRARGQVVVFGNGGSAAIAQHFAAELVGRFSCDRGPLPAVALTTDTSVLTAVANDFGFESVFERQVAVTAGVGDAVIGMSTSGMSENVARGLARAHELGARTIAFVGEVPGVVGSEAEIPITFPSNDPARIQELHLAALHVVCRQLDAIDFGGRRQVVGELE